MFDSARAGVIWKLIVLLCSQHSFYCGTVVTFQENQILLKYDVCAVLLSSSLLCFVNENE